MRQKNELILSNGARLRLFQLSRTATDSATLSPASAFDRCGPKDVYIVSTHEQRVRGFEPPVSAGRWLRSTVRNSRLAGEFSAGEVLAAAFGSGNPHHHMGGTGDKRRGVAQDAGPARQTQMISTIKSTRRTAFSVAGGMQEKLRRPDAVPRAEIDVLAGPFARTVGERARARHGFAATWEERLERDALPAASMAEARRVIVSALPTANVPFSVRSNNVPVQHGQHHQRHGHLRPAGRSAHSDTKPGAGQGT